jgi:integrase
MPRGRIPGPGRLVRRGAQWSLDHRDENGRRRFLGLSPNKAAAMQLWPEVIRRRDLARLGLGGVAGMDKPLAEVVAAYLDDLRPRVSPRHAAMVQARLSSLLGKLGPVRVQDLRPLAVTRLRNEALATGVAPRTANLPLDNLNACLRWAEANELVAKNPIARVARLPDGQAHARRRRRALGDDEVSRLLAAVDAEDRELARVAELDGRTRVPQKPLFAFLLALGTRYGETRLLTWGSVDFEQRLVVLQAASTKSRRQRTLPLSDELVGSLRALQGLQARVLGRLPSSVERVFLTAQGRPWCGPSNNLMRVFNRALARAGIRRTDVEGRTVDLHSLRHTCASRLVRRGVSIVHVQRLLGHRDVRLTAQTYSHVETEDLRAALEPAGAERRRIGSV